MLDGKVMGNVDPKHADTLVESLRKIKIQQQYQSKKLEGCVPKTLEIAYLLPSTVIKQGNETIVVTNKFFPGIFLSSQPSRFVRPVKNLVHGGIEFIGPLEQVNLSIAVQEEDLRSDSTH